MNSVTRAIGLVLKFATTLSAMVGFRLDHLHPTWIALGASSLLLARAVEVRGEPSLTLAYFFATLVFYYGGNAAMLGTRIRERWIARFGEQRAFRQYETVVALMFLNQGLGIGCVASLDGMVGAKFPVPHLYAIVLGAGLAGVGVLVKVWSTMILGVDVYYYKDLFLGRPVGEFVKRGPYRVLANPMYGVGHLHSYGWALCSGSVTALAAALLTQASVYLFYFAVERPFVRRVYLA